MGTPELWKAVWPRFGRVFPLEFSLSLLIMAAAWAVLAASAAPALFKARFAEPLFMLAGARYEVMERLALGAESGRGGLDEQRDVSRYVAARRIVGTTVVVSGVIPGAQPYEVGFYPALAQDEVVALWLCGRATVPEGWRAIAPAVTSNLPESLLLSQCRARRGA